MAGRVALLGISLLLSVTALTACADAGTTPDDARRAASADQTGAFQTRARQVAQAWQSTTGKDAWKSGFVPLQALTVPPKKELFTPVTERAFTAGWYRAQVAMPRETGGRNGTIRYPGGATATVPLVTRAEAYAALDKGDPPPCARPSVPPPAGAEKVDTTPQGAAGPDGSVSDEAPKSCVALTITGVTLGSVDLLTSRGQAQVPAWLFTVRELKAAVARVAVAPSAIAAAPTPATGQLSEVSGLATAQDLTAVAGTRLSYRLGVGACDENIKPLLYETDEAVVVAGTATRPDTVCTEQLVLRPVQVDLKDPLNGRPVLDGATGRVLSIAAVVGD